MKVLPYLRRVAVYLVKKVLVFVLGLVLLAALSFIFTGNLSSTTYSERIFWLGVVVFLIAGTIAMAQMIPGRLLLFPYNIRKVEDARRFVRQTDEFREQADKRIDLGIQLFLIGLGCLAVSALVQTFLG